MFVLSDKNRTNYSVSRNYYIEEQNIEVVELVHLKTEAKIICLICDDENRVFNIAFKTPVSNSKGTPHILEHSVLCGSKKYNVKDAFIELAKGSMNTFLNAMTFPDKTCYPVASANLKDFHNLVDVYLDAVFYPNAIKNDKIFRQEGWHYELEDKNADLKVNGVVFNEMKGVYSDPDSILESATLSNIFADTNYAYDYGGNPNEIYKLTFDEFKEFHHKYYSPTNSIVYFYGKLDYNYELEYLNLEYLQNFEKVDVDIEFKSNLKFVKNNEQIDYYSIDSKDNIDKSYLAYTFSLNDKKTSLMIVVMQIIDYILFSSDSAILKEKFLNEGFGEVVFSKCEFGLKDGYYSIISQNILESKKDAFIKLFDEYIDAILKNGIDIDKINAGINSLYFDYAEGEYSRIPRGIYLSLLSLDTYLYDGEATTFLEYKKAFDEINSIDLNDKNNIFYKTIKDVFINNDHRCINVLRPKLGYSAEKEKKICDELKNIKQNLKDQDLEKIINEMNALKDFQMSKDSKESLACIPVLKKGDIERDKTTIDYTLEKNENIDTIISYKNDKDIIYINVKFDITDLKKEEIFLFSIINNILSKIDLVSESYQEFNNYIDINTGGLSISIDFTDDKILFSYGIKVSKDKISCAFDIFYKLFSDAQFVDSKRINILLNECKQNSLLSILSSGHVTAMNRSKSSFDFRSYFLDKIDLNGIGFYKFISSISSNYMDNCDLINDSLDLLYKKLHRKKMYFTLCTNHKYHDEVMKCFNKFTDSIIKNKMKHIYTERDDERLNNNLKKIDGMVHFDSFDKKCKFEAILTPNDINFCALSGKFDPSLYSGKLSVLRTLFNYEYLWTNIRVLGGAYGCMSAFSKLGNYSLCSYRDPNLSKTNETYIGIPNFLSSFDKSDEEINKYIIGSIGSYDNPLSVLEHHKRNVAAYFNGITDQEYNQRRQEVLDLNINDIRGMANIFSDIDKGERCALVSASKLEEAKSSYDEVWQLME